MENRRFGNKVLYIVLATAIAVASFFAGMAADRAMGYFGEVAGHNLRLQKVSNLIKEKFYFQDTINKDKLLNASLAGMVGALGDPFSYYLDTSDLQSFTENIEGNYVGIGVEITVDQDNYITVTTAFSGSAAEKGGIGSGDKITKVYGEEVNGDMLQAVVAKIKGKPGEEVHLEITKPDGELKEVTLIRSEVTKETVFVRTINQNLGYIKISSFDVHTDREFKDKIAELDLKNLKGIILDLRSNPGGTLESVVQVADFFMPEGTIVKVKYTWGEEKDYPSDDAQVTLPLAVLINEGTASAAELLAGGLKDNNNATLIGKKSFGKGVVGQSFPVDTTTGLVLTVGEYFLPGGKNIHKTGIAPDIECILPKSDVGLSLLPESQDTQLQKAIEVLLK